MQVAPVHIEVSGCSRPIALIFLQSILDEPDFKGLDLGAIGYDALPRRWRFAGMALGLRDYRSEIAAQACRGDDRLPAAEQIGGSLEY